MTEVVHVECVRHGYRMFGCQVYVDGVCTAFLDGTFDGTQTLEEIAAGIREHEILNRAAPVIVAPDYAVRLRDVRRDKRITLKDLSDKLRISASELSDWERGRAVPPTYRKAYLWTMFLDVDPNEARSLFTRVDGAS